MKLLTVFLIQLFSFQVISQQIDVSNWIESKVGHTDFTILHPSDWYIGNSTISNVHWVGVPNFGIGNVIIKSVVNAQKIDFTLVTEDLYKIEYLKTSEIFSDVDILAFDPSFKVDGIDAIIVALAGIGKNIDKQYQEINVHFWYEGNAYTYQAQFDYSEPLSRNDLLTLYEVAKRITIH